MIAKKPAGEHSALAVFIFFLFASLAACAPGAAEKPGSREKQRTIITALIPEQKQAAAEQDPDPRLVLEQGNYWTAGIPGFGENALPAFTGEYRIPGKTALVWVWLTREFIFYDRWARRTSITSHTVLQKAEDIGRVVSVALDDTWTLVALLPKGTALTLEEEDQLIMVLIRGLSGYRDQNSRNISLPAAIPY